MKRLIHMISILIMILVLSTPTSIFAQISMDTYTTLYVSDEVIVQYKSDTALKNSEWIHKPLGTKVISRDFKLGFEVVKVTSICGLFFLK